MRCVTVVALARGCLLLARVQRCNNALTTPHSNHSARTAFCPAGSWSAAVGATSVTTCTPCKPGTFAGVLGKAACDACPAGTFQPQHGQAACTPCPAGTYGAATGATASGNCTACPADRPHSAPGSVAQSDCSADAAQACAPGWHYSSASDSCVQCTAGYACPGGLEPRQVCAPGSYTDSPQAEECALCAAGTYSSKSGGNVSSSCLACAPGSVSASDGAASCTPCAAGTSQASPGQQTCTPCPDNTLCPAGSAVPLPLSLAPAEVTAATGMALREVVLWPQWCRWMGPSRQTWWVPAAIERTTVHLVRWGHGRCL